MSVLGSNLYSLHDLPIKKFQEEICISFLKYVWETSSLWDVTASEL